MSISNAQEGFFYYAADWEVLPVTSADLTHLIRTAGKLGLLLFTQGSRRAEDGFFRVIFVLRAASEEVLTQFVQEAGARINLTHWTTISEERFHGAPFLGSRIVGFVEASQIYGRANAVLRAQRGAQN